jgi:hypothetical protein
LEFPFLFFTHEHRLKPKLLRSPEEILRQFVEKNRYALSQDKKILLNVKAWVLQHYLNLVLRIFVRGAEGF